MRRRQQNLNAQRGLGELPSDRDLVGPLIDPSSLSVPEWINTQTATNFPFTVGVVSQQIIPANPLRVYVIIQNKDSADDMFINFGNDATTYNGIIIIPRGNYELIGGQNGGSFVMKDSIHILGAAAGMDGVISEGILPPTTRAF